MTAPPRCAKVSDARATPETCNARDMHGGTDITNYKRATLETYGGTDIITEDDNKKRQLKVLEFKDSSTAAFADDPWACGNSKY